MAKRPTLPPSDRPTVNTTTTANRTTTANKTTTVYKATTVNKTTTLNKTTGEMADETADKEAGHERTL